MAGYDNDEHRKVRRNVARRYRKPGFEVIEGPTGKDLPSFLAGFSPDLIATSRDDSVVVEIKRADKLKGSNELTELAAKVAEHPAGRFELFTLAAPKVTSGPAPSKAALDRLLTAVSQAYDAEDLGRCMVSLTALISTVERLLNLVAVERGIEATDRSPSSLIRELSFQGVIGDTPLRSLEFARRWRDEIWHGRSGGQTPSLDEVEAVIGACRELQSALIEFWDEGSVGRREVDYSAAAVSRIPEARPAVNTIQAANGRVAYIGWAEAGRVREHIRRHLNERSRRMPGDKVTVMQFVTDDQARHAEKIAIHEFAPIYNPVAQGLESA